jgi:hypothetical protein
MGFSDRQLRALRRNLDSRDVRSRMLNGRELHYIEGWHAIAEANRIFGPDGWDRETVEWRCVLARDIRGQFTAIYIAKVRITVRADGETIVREGQGTGEASGTSPGEVHDIALKSAETDATKRALATFGKPFGLALYLSPKPIPRSEPRPATRPKPAEPARTGVADLRPVTADQSLRQPPAFTSSGSPAGRPGATASEVGQDQISTETAPLVPNNDNAPAEPTGIDKSVLRLAEPKRRRDKAHLKYVMAQPCLLCGRLPSDAHHLKFAQPTSLARKVSDEFTVPLCRVHHRQLHRCGDEVAWWNDMDIDPIPIAQGLWDESRALPRTRQ